MTNPTGKGGFQKGQSGNPGGRPKLPADIREAFKAKAPEALEVLTRCLQSDDDRIAMMAAQAILDRGYGKPTQSIDVREDGPTVRYIAEMPVKDETTEEWLKGNAATSLSTDEQCFHHWVPSTPHPRHWSWELVLLRYLACDSAPVHQCACSQMTTASP